MLLFGKILSKTQRLSSKITLISLIDGFSIFVTAETNAPGHGEMGRRDQADGAPFTRFGCPVSNYRGALKTGCLV